MSTNGTATLDTLREDRRRLRLELSVAEMKARKSMLEGLYDNVRLVDPFEKYRVGNELFIPIGGTNDKSKLGNNWPVFQNETELFQIIAVARTIAESNCYGIGLLGGLTAYVIGSGYIYKVLAKESDTDQRELVAAVQEVIDDFIELNAWSEMEQEIFRRSRRDGESFIRYYEDDESRVIVRTVEPEQVVKPPGGREEEWSFGVQVQTEPCLDVQTRLGYWITYSGNPNEGEEVPVSEVDHFKVNVDRIVKRGLSDFFAAQEVLESVRKLLRNMTTGAGLLSALTLIRQHSGVTKDQVSGFVSTQASSTSIDPATGQVRRNQTWRPGTTLDVPKGQEYVAPPLATANTTNFVQILQAALRCANTRWNAPEFMTGDASNGNFASSLTAESPFVRKAEPEQEFYRVRFLKTVKRPVIAAIKAGRLPPNTLDLVKIEATPPSIAVRDRLKEAQVFEIENRNGITSPQTWGATVGRDPEQEAKNIETWRKEHPTLVPQGPQNPLFAAMGMNRNGGQGALPEHFRGGIIGKERRDQAKTSDGQ